MSLENQPSKRPERTNKETIATRTFATSVVRKRDQRTIEVTVRHKNRWSASTKTLNPLIETL